jgi:hypothetical protein
MPRDTYEVHPVRLKEASDFEALVLALPETELDDKLAYLAREKGKITRNYFEDFIIANCVANINQLLAYINQTLAQSPDLIKIRNEILEHIFSYNPLLSPDNLVINKNYVVKTKKAKKLKADEKPLMENDSWGISYYDGNTNKEDPKLISEKKEELKDKVKSVSKDIHELEFEQKQVWWKRIQQYVNVKKFKEEDAENILKKRYFHSPTSFNTFIVSVCVVDFEDLFALLDSMKIPSRVAPPILMNELYELCKTMNTFLTYENAQKMADDEQDPMEQSNAPRQAPYKHMSGAMAQ